MERVRFGRGRKGEWQSLTIAIYRLKVNAHAGEEMAFYHDSYLV